ncbi:PIN domain-containing protein [Microcoleus sp. AS-A8]
MLFDSDVLLDVLSQRQPFVIASAQALNTVTQEQVQGYVSGHAVTNIFYILRRQMVVKQHGNCYRGYYSVFKLPA